MTNWMTRGSVGLTLFAALALLSGGCGQSDTKGSAAKVKDKGAAVAKKDADAKHDGWWCDEHGVPEGECSMCSAKIAAECKKKGDWCEKHDRAKSQCFLCEPKLKEKYAAVYRAKLGKEPPATEDEEKAKEGDKKGEKK